MALPFEVTWDYLCPFARNAHEHLVTALEAGAEWDVTFRFFSLSQSHAPEGNEVWSDPLVHSGVLAGLCGIVVRDREPDHFLATHRALFQARHDKGVDLRDPDAVARTLDEVGLEGAAVVEEALSGWPAQIARSEHQEAVTAWEVFGVPTFIADGRAAFVRLMTRPGDDAKLAEQTIERVLDLFENFAELNEYKFTQIAR
ncbi:MAG TPA: DsbA family protein [Acidimicrobiales bacterium]|nr:DsbA family protein [Acidimicrobiales bacterium]